MLLLSYFDVKMTIKLAKIQCWVRILTLMTQYTSVEQNSAHEPNWAVFSIQITCSCQTKTHTPYFEVKAN